MSLKLVHKEKVTIEGSPSNPRCLLETQNFEAYYNTRFSLNMPALSIKGNVIAILGHNGAGKSTLIKAILGLLPVTKGKISTAVLGDNLEQVKVLKPEADMAFCPENGSVFSDISVESYVKLWCRLKHDDAEYYKKEGQYYCDLLNLNPLLPKLGRELSKGQRRRVQTAIGFLTKPRLFLFDEPFEGLDVEKSHALAEIINDHKKRMYFIISSHRMDVIERLADSLIVLHEGQIVSTGSVNEVSKELAGQSIRIHHPPTADKVYAAFRENQANSLVTKIGNDIVVTGKHVNEAFISALLSQTSTPFESIDSSSPNLIDAMNYHLRTYNK